MKTVNRNKVISVKEIMRKYRLTYQTINHYTDLGLLSVLFKKGNVRFYDKNSVKSRLKKISRLMSEGYPLHLIRREL